MERRWSRQLYIPPLTALLYIFPPPLLDKLIFELCVLVLTKTLHITRNVAHVVGLRIQLTLRAQAHCLGELQGDARTFPDVSLNNRVCQKTKNISDHLALLVCFVTMISKKCPKKLDHSDQN